MATSDTLSLTEQLAKLSSKALTEKTGKDWHEWIEWLDELGGEQKSHRELVSLLADHIHSPWYRQKIALGFREAKGLRELGEVSSGYEVGVTRTVRVPLKKAWEIMTSQEGLAIWLGDITKGDVSEGASFETKQGITGTITVLEADSHFRMAWKPASWRNSSTLQVRVTGSKARSAGKSVINFHHEKLPRASDRAAMKKYWEEKLSVLAEIIKGK
ncbi:SRPBCC domain-containing protein [Dyadobacter sp. CY261]|uniref:SRPBCC domain-containing protein n=1 Tax=Dyadobacter sp. CY261 TaxID=2907203 RepID=UPI001F4820F0|nr:SRPBCC domain-containing protein [Dyadobacter sp. CY261]MCF0069936.1 SRPBCC domain-containing protein [Dyadobacter sp. CY261]